MKLSEHACGVFAAGHAEIEPLFRLGEQRVRIILAIIAALAAILLAHRRHHAGRQHFTFGKLHPFREYERRIVPGRIIGSVRRRRAGAARQAGQEFAELLAGERRDALLQPE